MLYPQCVYTGTVTDANGQLYNPPVHNIMSYYWDSYCKNNLTLEQYSSIYFSFKTSRSYLTSQPCLLTSINEPIKNDESIIYPSPNNGTFFIKTNSTIKRISISDALGHEVFFDTNIENLIEINLSQNHNGLYVVKIYLNDGKFICRKIIIESSF